MVVKYFNSYAVELATIKLLSFDQSKWFKDEENPTLSYYPLGPNLPSTISQTSIWLAMPWAPKAILFPLGLNLISSIQNDVFF